MSACEKLLEAYQSSAFSSKELVSYSVLALTVGVVAFFLCATGGPLSWYRAMPVTILSVLTGWLFSPLVSREKKGLVATVPHAMLLSLVILGFVALGGKMVEDLVDKTKADQQSTRLCFSLYAAGLVSGFAARTTVLNWINKLMGKLKEVPPIGSN